jgi:hypothetical protein
MPRQSPYLFPYPVPSPFPHPSPTGLVPIVAARNKTVAEEHLPAMSCLKGESKAKPKPGRFECDDCGAVVKKKSDVCEPKKIKKKKKKS